MRFSLPLRLCWLVTLVVVTYVATRSIAGQGRQSEKVHQPQPARIEAKQVLNARREQIAQAPDPRIISSGAMRSYKVILDGNVLRIQAHASLRDSRPNMRYVWLVRVLQDGKELSSRLYDNQILSLANQDAVTPTFEDAFDFTVPPGKYVIETSLYVVSPIHGLDGLRGPNRLRSLRGPAGSREVRVIRN
jgi:hypothetical protein